MKGLKFLTIILLSLLSSCNFQVTDNELEKLNEDLCSFNMRDKDYTDEIEIHKAGNVIFYKLENDSICLVKQAGHILDSKYRTLRYFHDNMEYLKMQDTIASFEKKYGCFVSDIFYISRQNYEGNIEDSNGVIMKQVMSISINK